MDRIEFEARLRVAARHAVQFARLLVEEALPDDVVFLVYPNQSYDGQPRVEDEVVFPDESLPEGEYHGPWPVAEVVGFLWRDGRVPEWIDTSVQARDDHHTVLGLRCCGRFTAREQLLYYRDRDIPGFGIKSPSLPPGWEDVEVSGRFSLGWRDRLHLDRPRPI